MDDEGRTKARMESEEMDVSVGLAERVNSLRDNGNKVCAIGTSVLRAMESAVGMNGHIKPYNGWTNKFLFPPYPVTTIDALVTTFHMPLSTMLMATASFGGYENVMASYKTAIDEKYRFGAYGDVMLIVD